MTKIVITAGCVASLNENMYNQLCSLGCQEALDNMWLYEEDLAHVREDMPNHYQNYKDSFRYNILNIKRNDPLLVQVVEQADWNEVPKACRMKVVEIPDDVEWYIYEAENGMESIHEEHRTWR